MVILKFSAHAPFSPEKIGAVLDKFKRKLILNAGAEPYLTYRKGEAKGEQLLGELETILKSFCER